MNTKIDNKVSGTPKEVSKAFGIPEKSLSQMRWLGKGPRYHKPSRRVLYLFKDVEDWIKQYAVHTRDSMDII